MCQFISLYSVSVVFVLFQSSSLGKMVFNWLDIHSEKFLDLYRHHENLWNTTHPHYRSHGERIKSYKDICQKMNCPGLSIWDVRNKINTMRTTYKVLLNKIIRSEKSGCTYVPQLFWFNKADEFLRPTVIKKMNRMKLNSQWKTRKSNSYPEKTVQKEYVTNRTSNEEDAEPENNFHSGIHEEPQFSMDNTSRKLDTTNLIDMEVQIEKDPLEPEGHNFNSFSNFSTPNAFSHFPNTNSNTMALINVNQLETLQTSLNKLQYELDFEKEVEEDEFDLFGKCIALQLRKMPLERALICQENLQRVMTEERLAQLNYNGNNQKHSEKYKSKLSYDSP